MQPRPPLLSFSLLLLPAACAAPAPRAELPLPEAVEAAHGGSLYGRDALEVDLALVFGGAERFRGRMLFEPSSGRARIELENGALAVFDGARAWVAPDLEAFPRARFHLLTWSYFLAAPWKLGDPGVRLDAARPSTLEGEPTRSARMTFGEGVGDSPDDWYVVYVDPSTHELRGLAYIVTYGTGVEEAEREPHVALYRSFQEVDGLRMPERIEIWNWSEEEGVVGEVLGSATFLEPRLVEPTAGVFEAPGGAVEDPLPPPASALEAKESKR